MSEKVQFEGMEFDVNEEDAEKFKRMMGLIGMAALVIDRGGRLASAAIKRFGRFFFDLGYNAGR